jgi:predicted acyltransferase
VVCLALGYLWSLEFPLNKNMWTSSFVLVAGGYSLCLLTLAFWAVEQQGWRKGWTWPWLVFGSNAIVAYMVSELLSSALWATRLTPSGGLAFTSKDHLEPIQPFLFHHTFAHIPDPGWAAFAYSVSFTAVCFIPVWILFRKKIFVKV